MLILMNIHCVKNICCLSNSFLNNMLDQDYVDFDYLKHKFEFNDDELYCSSDHKIEIIRFVTRAIFTDVYTKDLYNDVY